MFTEDTMLRIVAALLVSRAIRAAWQARQDAIEQAIYDREFWELVGVDDPGPG